MCINAGLVWISLYLEHDEIPDQIKWHVEFDYDYRSSVMVCGNDGTQSKTTLMGLSASKPHNRRHRICISKEKTPPAPRKHN